MNFQPSDEDEALIAAIRRGDAVALATLADQQQARLFAFIRRVAGDALLAQVEPEDLLQEAITSAVTSLAEVAGPELDPLAWLFGLIRRRVVDAHRYHFAAGRRNAAKQCSLDAAFAGAEQGGGFADLLANSMTTPSAAFSRNVKIARVREAIEQLEPAKREIIRWRYVEQLSTKEIASRTGKSDAAIRVALTRTVRQLETLLSR